MRLCGISSRFQLLSPCMRQVTHALLTRPPLSHKQLHSEKICRKCFVRLACVKHAASVHPEPGSNSHVLVLISSQFKLAIFVHSDISQNLLFKGFLILQEINLLDLSRFFTVQLSMFLLSATAYLIYHFKLFLSTTFSDFFHRPNSTNQCV